MWSLQKPQHDVNTSMISIFRDVKTLLWDHTAPKFTLYYVWQTEYASQSPGGLVQSQIDGFQPQNILISKSGVRSEKSAFYQLLRWHWCCWSEGDVFRPLHAAFLWYTYKPEKGCYGRKTVKAFPFLEVQTVKPLRAQEDVWSLFCLALLNPKTRKASQARGGGEKRTPFAGSFESVSVGLLYQLPWWLRG